MNFFKTKHNLFAVAVCTLLATTSCNKELELFQEIPAPQKTGQTLDKVLEGNPDDALFLAIVNRAGLLPLLQDSSKNYTLFVPVKSGIKQALSALSGGRLPVVATDAVFIQFIDNFIGRDTAAGIVLYHIIPQKSQTEQIGNAFPNNMLPTLLNPRPDTTLLIGPVIRLASFPSTRNGGWYNNVPFVGVNQTAYNGVIHHIASVAMPPTRTLWDRISADPELTYLKAAIIRADSGVIAKDSLIGYLGGFGANFTLFAPLDSCFQKTLTDLIAQTLIAQGVPGVTALQQASLLASTPDVFNNPILYPVLTAEIVRGVVVYHMLGKKAFTNNFIYPGDFKIPTLLNSNPDFNEHYGLDIMAVFNGVSHAPNAIKIKDFSSITPDANIIMSAPLTPEPFGKSDQNYTNGVMHKIDQVLLPIF